jgi:hypothetical protein
MKNTATLVRVKGNKVQWGTKSRPFLAPIDGKIVRGE